MYFGCFFFNAHGYKYITLNTDEASLLVVSARRLHRPATVVSARRLHRVATVVKRVNIRMMTKFWFALHVTYNESFSEDPRGAPRKDFGK